MAMKKIVEAIAELFTLPQNNRDRLYDSIAQVYDPYCGK